MNTYIDSGKYILDIEELSLNHLNGSNFSQSLNDFMEKKLETILMNIYGNTEDSNQHLVKKIFMHENLTEFNSIKGFLDHEEGILLYKMAKKYCIKTFAVEIGSIAENQHAISVWDAKRIELIL